MVTVSFCGDGDEILEAAVWGMGTATTGMETKVECVF